MSAFQALASIFFARNQGRRASRLPLAIICRAFGAAIRIALALGLIFRAVGALRFVSRLPSALYFPLLARCDSFRAGRGLSYSARSALLKCVNIDQVEFHENVFFFIGIALDAHAILINRFAELACKVTFFR